METLYKVLEYVVLSLFVITPVLWVSYRDHQKLRKQRQQNALSLQSYRMLIASHLAKQGVSIEGGAAEPYITWDHVDGPLLHLSTTELHWLTWKERFMLHFNLTTVNELDMALVYRKIGLTS